MSEKPVTYIKGDGAGMAYRVREDYGTEDFIVCKSCWEASQLWKNPRLHIISKDFIYQGLPCNICGRAIWEPSSLIKRLGLAQYVVIPMAMALVALYDHIASPWSAYRALMLASTGAEAIRWAYWRCAPYLWLLGLWAVVIFGPLFYWDVIRAVTWEGVGDS